MTTIGGVLFMYNYKDGTAIAASKAEEKHYLQKVRKQEYKLFMITKNSSQFIEFFCKQVVENIIKIEHLFHSVLRFLKA